MQTASRQEYKNLLNDCLKRFSVAFGPTITVLKLQKVSGIKINAQGEILEITSEPKTVFENLIIQFTYLSPFVVHNLLNRVLPEHPTTLNATDVFSRLSKLQNGINSDQSSHFHLERDVIGIPE